MERYIELTTVSDEGERFKFIFKASLFSSACENYERDGAITYLRLTNGDWVYCEESVYRVKKLLEGN